MPKVTDPVCGMTLDSDRAAAREQHGDHVHYFCSNECAASFRAAPSRYTVGESISREMRERTPPHTEEHGFVTPMFGSAGSGGAEYEPVPEEDEGPGAGKENEERGQPG